MEATDATIAFDGVIILMVVCLIIGLFMLIAMWKVFTKASQPGWANIIPIYNSYVLVKIAGKPGWWLLLLCIPFVNFVILFGLARNFGKGSGYTIGLILLPMVFIPMLAFGSAEYAPVEAPTA